MNSTKKTVYVGMSGGVDSSVTAALLKEQGYQVVGAYMKNWSQDLPGFVCPWKQDYQDAKRVAVRLGIDFELFDFEQQYFDKVVRYMVDEYSAGRTPNPDIMCNQEIKFKLFLETALERGADMIATGHYARVKHTAHGAELHTAINQDKDQTYFLYRVSQEALRQTMFPLGEYETKQQVRDIARQRGLAIADKKDSVGVCFVGKVGIKEFLQQYVDTAPGPIINQSGRVIGQHDGAIFYTFGQRHGLNVGGGLPYYVVDKNMDKNEVYVTTNLDDRRLWRKQLLLHSAHWLNEEPQPERTYQIRTRYRAPLVDCRVEVFGSRVEIVLSQAIKASTPGQSAVVYEDSRVVGGGIIMPVPTE